MDHAWPWSRMSADMKNLGQQILWCWLIDDGSHMHPHFRKYCSHLIYVWHGCDNHSLLIYSLHHHITVGVMPDHDQEFNWHEKIWSNKCYCDAVMMDPCAHPHHINYGKYVIYVWHGSDSHAILCWSAPQSLHNSMICARPWSRISAYFSISNVWARIVLAPHACQHCGPEGRYSLL